MIFMERAISCYAGATIQVANLVNYSYHPLEDGLRMAMNQVLQKVHLFLRKHCMILLQKRKHFIIYSIALFLRRNIHKHVLCISLRPSIIT